MVKITAWPAKRLAKRRTAREKGLASWLIISIEIRNISIGHGPPLGAIPEKYFTAPCFFIPTPCAIKKIMAASVAVKLMFAVGGVTPGIAPSKLQDSIKENRPQKKGSHMRSWTIGSIVCHK